MSLNVKFPLTEAQLVGNWCETLFYGVYLMTCASAARTLLFKGRGRDERWLRLDEVRWLMMFFALALFGILTFDVAIGLQHNYIAFIQTNGSDGPLTEFLNLTSWINVARSITQSISMQLADFILIYRCWIVYGGRWITIAPSTIIFFANTAISSRIVQLVATSTDTSVHNGAQLSAWLITAFAMGTVQNVLSTGLLIFRIWRVDRNAEKYGGSSGTMGGRQPRQLRKVVIMIAESGAFYTITVFLSLVLITIKSNGFYATANTTIQSTGIVFNVILVRASAIRDEQLATYPESVSTLAFHYTMARPEMATIDRDTQAETEISLTASVSRSKSRRSRISISNSHISALGH